MARYIGGVADAHLPFLSSHTLRELQQLFRASEGNVAGFFIDLEKG